MHTLNTLPTRIQVRLCVPLPLIILQWKLRIIVNIPQSDHRLAHSWYKADIGEVSYTKCFVWRSRYCRYDVNSENIAQFVRAENQIKAKISNLGSHWLKNKIQCSIELMRPQASWLFTSIVMNLKWNNNSIK